MPILRFIVSRLLTAVPVLLAAATLTFFLIRFAPGGPFTEERDYPPETLERLNAHYGFNDPVHVQYFRYLGKLVRGDLGPAMKYADRSVNTIIAETFPVSLELGFHALLVALALGLTAGVAAALRVNTWFDHLVMGFAMTGICLPSFVMGPILVLVFGLGLGWFNASGWNTPADRVLPAITLGTAYAAYIARLSRAGMLDVLPQEFIRAARAKGLSEARVILVHALRPGVFPVISFLGPAIAGLITGSFVTETIFHIPGLGRMFVTSAFNRDYFLVLGLVVFYSAVVIAFNLLADIAMAIANPKLREGLR